MSRLSPSAAIAALGTDLGKNSFHLVGQDEHGGHARDLTRSEEFLGRRVNRGCPLGWPTLGRTGQPCAGVPP